MINIKAARANHEDIDEALKEIKDFCLSNDIRVCQLFEKFKISLW